MSAPILEPQRRENPDPTERSRPMPWFVLMLIAMLLAFCMVYIVQSEVDTPSAFGDARSFAELRGKPGAEAGSAIDAAAIYAARCAACHQAGGQGLPGVFPPLAGSEWVNGRETTLAAIVLHGVTGALTVKGNAFSGVMPTFKEQLSDAELAALLSHLRSQWGNTAAPITAATVAEVRQATAERSKPFDGDKELAALP